MTSKPIHGTFTAHQGVPPNTFGITCLQISLIVIEEQLLIHMWAYKLLQ